MLGSTRRDKLSIAEDTCKKVAKVNADEPLPTVHLVGQHFYDLISNQVGLPAELKHINKRRKRN